MLTPIAQFHSGLAERPGLAGGAEAGDRALSDRILAEGAAARTPRGETAASAGDDSPAQHLGHALESFDRTARQVVGKAIDVLRDDIGAVLEDMGLDGETARALMTSLLQPLQQALESGADFSAQVSLLAVQQQTAVSGNAFAQHLQLVAKSLEIEVNHATGEISVDLKSLSIEQSVAGRFGGGGFAEGAAPLLPLGGGSAVTDLFGSDLAGFIEDLLERIEAPEADDRGPGPSLDDAGLLETLVPEDVERPDSEGDDEEDGAADGEAVAVEARTRFALQAVERFANDLGQTVTRLRLDASVQLAALVDLPARSDAGQAEKGQRDAGTRVLDLKI